MRSKGWGTRGALRRVAVPAVGSLFLSACAPASAPIPLSRALREIRDQLAAAGAVSAVGSDPSRFAAAVAAAQCAAREADPEIPVLAHDLTLDLSGSFTVNGGFEVAPVPAASFLTLGATGGRTQELSLPLSFVAVSELPALVTAQRLAPLAALPEADRAAETAPILADRDRLRRRVAVLIAAWTPSRCSPGPGAPPELFQPNERYGSAGTGPDVRDGGRTP